jgi:hypothetical protein
MRALGNKNRQYCNLVFPTCSGLRLLTPLSTHPTASHLMHIRKLDFLDKYQISKLLIHDLVSTYWVLAQSLVSPGMSDESRKNRERDVTDLGKSIHALLTQLKMKSLFSG